MTDGTMKSGVIEPDRGKIDLRHPHRRKMAKSLHIVNGGGNIEEVNMMRQVNLAAAYHDHISCTKSADLCNKISDAKDSRANLPFETDHIYANCSENKLSKIYNMVAVTPSRDERRQLQDMCLLHLELIKHLEDQNAKKEKQIRILRKENDVLKAQRRIRRKQNRHSDKDVSGFPRKFSSLVYRRKESSQIAPNAKGDNPSPITPAVHLATRYFGRRSKTIPLRALKRRYWGPPKEFPCQKSSTIKSSSSTASVSSVSENQDEDNTPNFKDDSGTEPLVSNDVQEKNSTKVSKRLKYQPPKCQDFLTTKKEYYLPSTSSMGNNLNLTKPIEVPSWRYKQFLRFYHMEGTEDLDAKIFERRHVKHEQEERRRKRWDNQRIREQQANEKLKLKSHKNVNERVYHKKDTFYPDPYELEEIEITDVLPVIAFGQPIALFQPSEYNKPTWNDVEHKEERSKKSDSE